MLKKIRAFLEASVQTKFFIFNWGLYGALIILSSIYCYGRLDYVRTRPALAHTTVVENPKPQEKK